MEHVLQDAAKDKNGNPLGFYNYSFEELIRKFAEQSNEEAGEHFTPRDVVGLMTRLIFVENGENLKQRNIIKTVYDPACGTGGMLTSCEDFITKFDFIISNPPYGRKWEQDADAVKNEAEKGFGGRFGAGLPRINDGQLLFLQHMISKMKLKEKSRIVVITISIRAFIHIFGY